MVARANCASHARGGQKFEFFQRAPTSFSLITAWRRPLTFEQPKENRVLNLTIDVPTLAQQSFPAKTKSLHCPNGSSIARVDIGLESAEVQLSERIAKQSL